MFISVRPRPLPLLLPFICALTACGSTEPPVVSTVELSPPSVTLAALGEPRQLTALARDANGTEVRGKRFHWRSMQPTVATIDSVTGVATAVANGTATITATVDGVIGQGTLTVAQAGSQLAFVVQPSDGTAGQALAPALQIEIRDTRGNRVTGASDAVTMAVGANPRGGTLSGTKTVNAVDGVAAFGDLSIERAGTGYALAASSGLLTAATSTAFSIGPASPAQLGFTTQPSNSQAGTPINPAVAVTVQDAFGNTVTLATDAVTIAIAANPGSATLSGTSTVAAVAGIARFTDLSITKAVAGYTLVASSGSLAPGTSGAFTIVAGPPAQALFAGQPSDVQANMAMAPVTVSISDAFGNAASGSVAVAIEGNPWGGPGTKPGRLSGTLTMSAPNGSATFADLRVDKPGDGYTLRASSGTASGVSTPFHVRLTFSTVVAGVAHTCSLASTGAYCWGNNYGGRLGVTTGSTVDDSVPAFLDAGLTFAQISAGANQSCAVTADNVGYCWGLADLGNGATDPGSVPGPVSGGIKFTSISSGFGHTCGLATNGSVYCWGENPDGQLGDGTTVAQRLVPVLVVGSGTTLQFTAVSAGSRFSCALATDQSAYCWGNNDGGQLGDSTRTSSATPVRVFGSGTTLLFTSLSAGTDHTCAVTTSHDAYCWGRNNNGQRGSLNQDPIPSLVAGGLSFASVSAGAGFSCGVTTGNVAYCWGFNPDGRVGNGTTGNQFFSPVPVSGGLAFASVSAGFHACGVTTAGEAYCWGPNDYGEVGDGTRVNPRLAPVRVIQ